jgi:hypothetical protein
MDRSGLDRGAAPAKWEGGRFGLANSLSRAAVRTQVASRQRRHRMALRGSVTVSVPLMLWFAPHLLSRPALLTAFDQRMQRVPVHAIGAGLRTCDAATHLARCGLASAGEAHSRMVRAGRYGVSAKTVPQPALSHPRLPSYPVVP